MWWLCCKKVSDLIQYPIAGCLPLPLDGIKLHAVVRKLLLIRRQPLRSQWRIGQEEEPNNGDHECDSTLEDEQPLPA
jgi:hypothetical protein